MTAGAKCPFCEQPISVWAVMKAPMPSVIRCPHCRQKIRVREVGVYLIGYILMVAVVAALLIIARRRDWISTGVLIAAAVAFCVVLEFITSILVLRRARFVKPSA